MSSIAANTARSTGARWLKQYYLYRAAFSAVWVAAALTLGQQSFVLGAILLVIYPLWDAAANYVDALGNGGLAGNRIQAINVFVSSATALAVLAALQMGLSAVLAVFGVWAVLSGLLQLATAIRRWKAGAQWAMVLSGGQSALAGAFFVFQAQQAVPAVLPVIAGYAGFGAVYFLVSALWLIVRQSKHGVGEAQGA
ncbi:DUF308 domain-containing protein [Devosia ginsengisoli]|uniref:DUF308 domain-containing protein n=1 Tax=Devosia ginsengisoli TaxID=400770 RepID=A0A5B8LX24_9HYPH|nr:DUF308 domain-containing protein [Devosia ginsengisoli]QDZ12546.1 DUF308 domain-containing protein [Devosia ginsengisoli]